ncbi:hypothetical protein D0S45_05165 [Marinifilum sp. JC120]|nr:hypothetical protein D0S45_05165 [Marinifilum sp. JC120]
MRNRIFKEILVTLLFCAGLFLTTASAWAEKFTLVSLEYEPYSCCRNGTLRGYDIELLQECFLRMDEELEIMLVPWKRALHMGMYGDADGVFGVLKLPERAEKMFFSVPVRDEKISFFVRHDSPLVYDEDLNKFRNFSFGVVSGYSYGKDVDAFLKNDVPASRVEVGVSPEMNIAKLLKGRFDIYVGDTLSSLNTIHKMGVAGQVRNLGPPFSLSDVHVAFSKKRKLGFLRDRFNIAFESMRADGTLDRIKKKYFDE